MSVDMLRESVKWVDSEPETPAGWPYFKSAEADRYAWPIRYVWDGTLDKYIPKEFYEEINILRFGAMGDADQRREFEWLLNSVADRLWAQQDKRVMAAVAAYKKPSLWQQIKGWLK